MKILKNSVAEDFIQEIKLELDEGSGITLVDNCNEKDFMNIVKSLGTLTTQNINNDKIVTIKDRGKKLSEGGRYHQTNSGGSYHTDCPQWNKLVNYVGLYCVSPAIAGGNSKLVKVKDIYEKIKKETPDLLETLFGNFYFDKREYLKGENKTIFVPIFSYINNKICCRYLKEYVLSGHILENSPLTNIQQLSLKKLDEVIHDKSLTIDIKIDSGQGLLINNLNILHGRDSFTDGKIKREFRRMWICRQ